MNVFGHSIFMLSCYVLLVSVALIVFLTRMLRVSVLAVTLWLPRTLSTPYWYTRWPYAYFVARRRRKQLTHPTLLEGEGIVRTHVQRSLLGASLGHHSSSARCRHLITPQQHHTIKRGHSEPLDQQWCQEHCSM